MTVFYRKLIIRLKSFFLRFKFKHSKLGIPIYFDYLGKLNNRIYFSELNSKQADKTYFSYSPILFNIRGNGKIIGEKIILKSGCFFSVSDNGLLKIGDDAFFNTNCYVLCRDNIKIGTNFMASDNVYIRDNDGHKFSVNNICNKFGSIEIGNNVWLGRNVIVLKGVKIGDNVIVGAGSVVSKNIPSNCIAVGNPAKVIKKGKIIWKKF